MKKMLRILSVLVVASLLLAACGPVASAVVETTTQKVVFIDPIFQREFETALAENPQMTYTDEEYAQVFWVWYGTDHKEVFAAQITELESGGDYRFSAAPAILKMTSPIGWAYAAVAAFGSSAVLAFNATQAANAELPVITFDLRPDTKVVVPASYAATTGILMNRVDFPELQHASKSVAGATAYWGSLTDGCFFGIHFSSGAWSAFTTPNPCPEGPDDEAGIAKKISELWEHYKSIPGQTWGWLAKTGERGASMVEEAIALAKAYGLDLVP